MNHKVMTICAVAREVCVAAWAKVTNAQNEHSDSLLGSFGHQATETLKTNILRASWGHLATRPRKRSKRAFWEPPGAI